MTSQPLNPERGITVSIVGMLLAIQDRRLITSCMVSVIMLLVHEV